MSEKEMETGECKKTHSHCNAKGLEIQIRVESIHTKNESKPKKELDRKGVRVKGKNFFSSSFEENLRFRNEREMGRR